MQASTRRLAKWVILVLICAVAVITCIRLASGLRQRFGSIERVDVKGKAELDLIGREHVARYEFAKKFCAGKTVADIASGTGYGTETLRTVAASVDGYDIEPLGQEYVVDLEKESWSKHYDVIVSLETIEHLANPKFFLRNVCDTTKLLVLSTTINERKGWATNPYHKQFWTDHSLKRLLAQYLDCDYYYQRGDLIGQLDPETVGQVLAVCVPKEP